MKKFGGHADVASEKLDIPVYIKTGPAPVEVSQHRATRGAGGNGAPPKYSVTIERVYVIL